MLLARADQAVPPVINSRSEAGHSSVRPVVSMARNLVGHNMSRACLTNPGARSSENHLQ